VDDQKVSPVDPYASPMPATKGSAAVPWYRDHYVVDGGKARIILRALVTPASILENTPKLEQNIKSLLQHALDVFCFVFNQPILSFSFR